MSDTETPIHPLVERARELEGLFGPVPGYMPDSDRAPDGRARP